LKAIFPGIKHYTLSSEYNAPSVHPFKRPGHKDWNECCTLQYLFIKLKHQKNNVTDFSLRKHKSLQNL